MVASRTLPPPTHSPAHFPGLFLRIFNRTGNLDVTLSTRHALMKKIGFRKTVVAAAYNPQAPKLDCFRQFDNSNCSLSLVLEQTTMMSSQRSPNESNVRVFLAIFHRAARNCSSSFSKSASTSSILQAKYEQISGIIDFSCLVTRLTAWPESPNRPVRPTRCR